MTKLQSITFPVPLSFSGQAFYIHFGRLADAEQLVKRFHYSRRLPGNVTGVFTLHERGGLFGEDGKPIAAAVFGIPANRWKERLAAVRTLVALLQAMSAHQQVASPALPEVEITS